MPPGKPTRYLRRDKKSREARFHVKKIAEQTKDSGIGAQRSTFPS